VAFVARFKNSPYELLIEMLKIGRKGDDLDGFNTFKDNNFCNFLSYWFGDDKFGW
jgi:hypothetical protein